MASAGSMRNAPGAVNCSPSGNARPISRSCYRRRSTGSAVRLALWLTDGARPNCATRSTTPGSRSRRSKSEAWGFGMARRMFGVSAARAQIAESCLRRLYCSGRRWLRRGRSRTRPATRSCRRDRKAGAECALATMQRRRRSWRLLREPGTVPRSRGGGGTVGWQGKPKSITDAHAGRYRRSPSG